MIRLISIDNGGTLTGFCVHHAVSAIECRKAIARRQTTRGAGTAGPAHE
jgi:hypothetical protein